MLFLLQKKYKERDKNKMHEGFKIKHATKFNKTLYVRVCVCVLYVYRLNYHSLHLM